MDTEISIEVLTKERAAEMIAFHHLCFPFDAWKDEDWEDLLSDPRAVYYALLDGGRIVGNVFIYNWQGEADYVKIMNLSVHPEYRGKGYAHRLLNHVTEQMRPLGMKRFCAETRASNKPMQKVFDDCGYRFRKEEDVGFENPKENGYKYELKL
ncbi:MAG: GNAT family N-acetyltransferase [Clostridia bacterium]|jgi:ribosomal-protein-alanine N-acetyltransferase|nr:GNAT family N-acetyltransferase [Clostridia bacterium]